MSYVMFFDEIAPLNLELVGSKAESLASVFSKHKLPAGFVVTTLGMQYFLESTGIKNKISGYLSEINEENSQKIANDIQKLIVNSSVPQDLSSQMIESYYALSESIISSAESLLNAKEKDEFVAVSQSSIDDNKAEEESYLSFLNIKGKDAVLNAIKIVFASFYTKKNILARKKAGKNLQKIAAVVVQKMINAEKSAIVYIGNTSKIRINSIFGVGEGFLDSSIPCDLYSAEKDSLNLLGITISEQKIKYAAKDNESGIIKMNLGGIGKMQKLSKTEIIECIKIAKDIGDKFKIEIAIQGSSFYVIRIKQYENKEDLEGEEKAPKLEVYKTTFKENSSPDDEFLNDEAPIYDKLEQEIEKKQGPLQKENVSQELKPKIDIMPLQERINEEINYDEEDDLKEEFEKAEYKVYENETYEDRKKRMVPVKSKKEQKEEDEEDYKIYEPEEFSKIEPEEKSAQLESDKDDDSKDESEEKKEPEPESKKTAKKEKRNEEERYGKDKEEDKVKENAEEDDSIFSSLKTY